MGQQRFDGGAVAERAGYAVVGFGGKADTSPFGKCLDRPMDDIAGVFGAAQVDDRWRHGQGRGVGVGAMHGAYRTRFKPVHQHYRGFQQPVKDRSGGMA